MKKATSKKWKTGTYVGAGLLGAGVLWFGFISPNLSNNNLSQGLPVGLINTDKARVVERSTIDIEQHAVEYALIEHKRDLLDRLGEAIAGGGPVFFYAVRVPFVKREFDSSSPAAQRKFTEQYNGDWFGDWFRSPVYDTGATDKKEASDIMLRTLASMYAR